MKKVLGIFAFGALLGCGSTAPKSTPPNAVVIPKPVPTVVTETASEPLESTVPAKPKLQIAIGDEMVCLRIEEALRCWRRSEGVQGPIATTLPPIAGLGAVTDVAVGMRHVCALNKEGKVFCWGDNSHGQLGAGRNELTMAAPVQVPGIEGATAIAVGMMHSCALLSGGRVSCWGWNADGQTGSDVEYAEEVRELVAPEIVAGISGATTLAAGRDQTCVKTNAGMWCWGRSHLKSQSNVRGYHHNAAARVPELDDLQQISLKGETACGLFKDGHVGCWGSGAFTILPNRPLRAEEPLPLVLPEARRLVSDTYHGCAILQNGRVWCWGWNNHGELGRQAQKDYESHESALVEGLPTPVDSLSLGSGTSCAVVRKDELWCWGVAPNEPWVHDAGSGTPRRIAIGP